MSLNNAEVIRRLLETNCSEDLEAAIETAVSLTHPNNQFTSVMAAVEPETYRGHDGTRRYFRDMADSWSEWRMEVEEVHDVDAKTVVAVFRSHLVGKQSGATVEAQRALVAVLSEGKILRGQVYPSREEAFESLDLNE